MAAELYSIWGMAKRYIVKSGGERLVNESEAEYQHRSAREWVNQPPRSTEDTVHWPAAGLQDRETAPRFVSSLPIANARDPLQGSRVAGAESTIRARVPPVCDRDEYRRLVEESLVFLTFDFLTFDVIESIIPLICLITLRRFMNRGAGAIADYRQHSGEVSSLASVLLRALCNHLFDVPFLQALSLGTSLGYAGRFRRGDELRRFQRRQP
jgi:hypothetical protein